MKKQDKGFDLTRAGDLTEEQARTMLEKLRWPDGPRCPTCGSDGVMPLAGGRAGLYRCKACPDRRQFTVTVGTIFEDSHVPLRKWIMAFHLMCSAKKGISALQVKRSLGVAYQTAWHMCHRIRWAMRQEPLAGMLKGTVEADETYVSTGARPRGGRGRGTPGKTIVVALVERKGPMHARVVPRASGPELKGAIREAVDRNSTIMTDEWGSYRGIGKEFAGGHQTVEHGAKEYVRGNAHVNTAESFFALLKRGVHGSFHHVSKKHLWRYVDEFSFRWNHRNTRDGERTLAALQQVEGKRLTYKPLTGL